MKVIIAGSRSISDLRLVYRAVKESGFPISEVVSGAAQGVDTLGEEWARTMGVPIKRFPAAWDLYDRAAGYVRNSQMAEYADAAIVIWDGRSKGAKHMIRVMGEIRKPVYVLRTGGQDG